jgi:hypothetical protein
MAVNVTAEPRCPQIALHDGTSISIGAEAMTIIDENKIARKIRGYVGVEQQLINVVLSLRSQLEAPSEPHTVDSIQNRINQLHTDAASIGINVKISMDL